jgi:hypothetical protein
MSCTRPPVTAFEHYALGDDWSWGLVTGAVIAVGPGARGVVLPRPWR